MGCSFQLNRPLGHAAFRTLDVDEHEPVENLFRAGQCRAVPWQVGGEDLAEPVGNEHGGCRSSRTVSRAHVAVDVRTVVHQHRKRPPAALGHCGGLRCVCHASIAIIASETSTSSCSYKCRWSYGSSASGTGGSLISLPVSVDASSA